MIGEISSGTLRPQDLLATFADTLDTLVSEACGKGYDGKDARRAFKLIFEAQACAKTLDTDCEPSPYHLELAGELIAELSDALDMLAPPMVRFGAHEGDGACFGFWPLDLEEMKETCEVIVGEAGASYVAMVSDHGNVSLHEIGPIIWDVV